MIGLRMKSPVFDASRLEILLSKAIRRGLFAIGKYTRTTSQRSMKKSNAKGEPSSPGEPPRARVGTLKRFVLFDVNDATRSVVIGPKSLRTEGKDAPEALEYGGEATSATGQKINVEQRPFMTPALDKARAVLLPDLWRNSIK